METGFPLPPARVRSAGTPVETGNDDILDLLRMRAQVRQQMVRGREELGRLAGEFARIEDDISRLTGVVRMPESGPGRPDSSGAFTRLVLQAIDDAQRPLNAREIARRVMTDMGLDADDRDLRRRIMGRVNITLWTQTQKGRLRQSQPKTSPIRWELVEIERRSGQ